MSGRAVPADRSNPDRIASRRRTAASMPAAASSTSMHCRGGTTDRRSSAARNTSGSGLAGAHVLGATIASKD